MSRFVGYGKKLFDLAKGGGKDSGTTKVSTTIVGVEPKVGSLTERRKHFEDIVKGTDKYTKSLTNEGKIKVKKNVSPTVSKISKIMDKKDNIRTRNKGSKKLFKAAENKSQGGRVGLKRGTGLMKRKSDIQKIKETFSPKKSAAKKSTKFGMLSVKAGIDKNPNPTQADRIAGAKMKSKKRFV